MKGKLTQISLLMRQRIVVGCLDPASIYCLRYLLHSHSEAVCVPGCQQTGCCIKTQYHVVFRFFKSCTSRSILNWHIKQFFIAGCNSKSVPSPRVPTHHFTFSLFHDMYNSSFLSEFFITICRFTDLKKKKKVFCSPEMNCRFLKATKKCLKL